MTAVGALRWMQRYEKHAKTLDKIKVSLIYDTGDTDGYALLVPRLAHAMMTSGGTSSWLKKDWKTCKVLTPCNGDAGQVSFDVIDHCAAWNRIENDTAIGHKLPFAPTDMPGLRFINLYYSPLLMYQADYIYGLKARGITPTHIIDTIFQLADRKANDQTSNIDGDINQFAFYFDTTGNIKVNFPGMTRYYFEMLAKDRVYLVLAPSDQRVTNGSKRSTWHEDGGMVQWAVNAPLPDINNGYAFMPFTQMLPRMQQIQSTLDLYANTIFENDLTNSAAYKSTLGFHDIKIGDEVIDLVPATHVTPMNMDSLIGEELLNMKLKNFLPYYIQLKRIEGIVTDEDEENVASNWTVKDYIRILHERKGIDFVPSTRFFPKGSEASTPERVEALILSGEGGIKNKISLLTKT